MMGCMPVDTPMDVNVKLGMKENDEPVNKGHFQRLVGKLIYLAHTRPDIAFVVSCVSQFMHSPSKSHLDVVYRILKYLKGTPGKGVLFRVVISIAHNPIHHDRTNHVEVDRHFIKEKIDDVTISVTYVPTTQQKANILAKALFKSMFERMIDKLGMYNLYYPA